MRGLFMNFSQMINIYCNSIHTNEYLCVFYIQIILIIEVNLKTDPNTQRYLKRFRNHCMILSILVSTIFLRIKNITDSIQNVYGYLRFREKSF